MFKDFVSIVEAVDDVKVDDVGDIVIVVIINGLKIHIRKSRKNEDTPPPVKLRHHFQEK